MWEKEKLLVTSNFSFSHSVFKRLFSQGRQKVSLCGNGLMGSFLTVLRTFLFPSHWLLSHTTVFETIVYGTPLLQAWLLPDLNTKPNNCVRENSLWFSGYGIGIWCTRSLVRILLGSYISAMHLFICFIVTDFVRKTMDIGERQKNPVAQ